MSSSKPLISLPLLIIVILFALAAGFGVSRLNTKSSTISMGNNTSSGSQPLSADTISNKAQIKVGQIFGNNDAEFKDTAEGVIEAGNINGEGTHILNREGGVSQRASLTSSVIDLDLFVGRKVQIKGATQASKKTSWLLDVGWLKVLE